MSFRVFFDRRHGPHVLGVEASRDQRSQGTKDDRHGDGQDEPPDDLGAAVLRLERVMDVYLDRRLELADVNCVVEVE
jgi:hypothetical protein